MFQKFYSKSLKNAYTYQIIKQEYKAAFIGQINAFNILYIILMQRSYRFI
jgi:hypothetical protein